MNLQQTIKQNIKTLVKDSGKSQKTFCEENGINYDLYTQYTTVEKRKIPHEWIKKIAEATNTTTDYIYGR